MKLTQRLGSETQYTDTYTAQILKNHKDYPGSVDEVWLATTYGFPPLDVHFDNARRLAGIAKRYRAAGIAVSLQLSNSIGHGQYMSSRDCSGLVGVPGVEPLVGEDGMVAPYCFCWWGESFRQYLLDEVEAYVRQIRPDALWIDDDFRADNHNPAKYGCFCDQCIARFNRTYGTAYDRPALLASVLHGSAEDKTRWLTFLREGLCDLMRVLCHRVRATSPETVIGLQNANHGYTGFGLGFLYDVIREETGHDPLTRPGGGAYNDHDPGDIVRKSLAIAYQRASMPSYIRVIAPEIENLPFNYSGKSPAGTAFETSLYLADGSTDMTYSMMMSTPEPEAFYRRYYQLFSEHRAYWEALGALSRRSVGGGITRVISREGYLRTLRADAGLADFASEPYIGGTDLLLRTGLPLTYDRAGKTPLLLTPAMAVMLSDREIRELLTQPVMTDGETLDILQKRGYFDNISLQKLTPEATLRVREHYEKHPTTEGLIQDFFAPSYFVQGKREAYTFADIPAGAEILGTYETTSGLPPFYEGAYPHGICSFITDTPGGGRWAVFGIGLWKGNIPSSRLFHLLRVADALGERTLPVRPETPEQVMLLPRVSADGEKTLAVSAVNLTIAPVTGMTLRIRRAAGAPCFMGQYQTPGALPATPDGDDLLVTLPSLAPYSVSTVFLGDGETS